VVSSGLHAMMDMDGIDGRLQELLPIRQSMQKNVGIESAAKTHPNPGDGPVAFE
jgi:hypothetical protein